MIYLLATMFILIFLVNIYIVITTNKYIMKDNSTSLKSIDCILVLGAGVINNSRPTLMLKDRLDKGVELYKLGLSPKIVMSGDHGRADYDEVNIMKEYAKNKGVPSEDIFMDHAGFNSYDSIYRVKEIFGAKRIIIVTQKYHLYRAIYIANKLGIIAYGAKSDARIYTKMPIYYSREILARLKNFIKCIVKPLPKYMGEKISLNQSGDITNDR